MKIHIKTKNMDLTEAIQNHVESKINELEKLITDPIESVEAWVEVGKSTNHHNKGEVFKATVDIKMPGRVVRAEEELEDLYMAVNQVKDELQRELKRHKEKQITKARKSSRLFKKIKSFLGTKDE